MQKNINEIKTVLEKHEYSINTIICDVAKKFKLKTICSQIIECKNSGYKPSDIIMLMVMMPLMLLNSVHSLYKSQYKNTVAMKKDAIYRLKNNEKMPWRRLLYAISKQFKNLVSEYTLEKDKKITAFIIDDTSDIRVGEKIENISFIHDHTSNKKGSRLGFKHLMLGYFDGVSILPLDFTTHKEKPLSPKKRKMQYKKDAIKNSNGYKRRKECKDDKITSALKMIKRATKNGFSPNYVLADSWFTSLKFISTVRNIKNGSMHIIAGIKNDKRHYVYQDMNMNGKELIVKLQKEGKQKRCRQWNTRYFEVTVEYPGVGEVKLYICRFPYQKKWRLFISTDVNLTFTKMMETYSVRWTIEIMFKELKQHLHLGKCKSQDFDAQIADITISLILFVFLSYYKRVSDYESLGTLFIAIKDDICEKNLAQRIWEMFDELLSVVINLISKNGMVDLCQFQQSLEYVYLKELFESSFLNNQLLSIDK